MKPNHRDLALEHLADDEADLHGYIRELQADVRTYREIVSVLLERLHYATHSIEGLQRALRAVQSDERQERRAA